MVIQEAAEMYLETILSIQNEKGSVRSIDIAKAMEYSKPTVSEQMKKFRLNGYINVDKNGYITLTQKGLEIAKTILERHNVLTEIFIKIGVNDETAQEDACRIEHYISEETFDCMKKHFNIK